MIGDKSNCNDKWNEFSNNVMKTFWSLQKEEELCDVTLISDDKVSMKAHKLVLSACSEFFNDIFKSEMFKSSYKCASQILFLGGIDSKMLSAILQYIYSGETQIKSVDFDLFLDKAKMLKLVGLTNAITSLELHKPTNILVPKEDMDNNCGDVNDEDKVKQVVTDEYNDAIENGDKVSEVSLDDFLSEDVSQNSCHDVVVKKENSDFTMEDNLDKSDKFSEHDSKSNYEDYEDTTLEFESLLTLENTHSNEEYNLEISKVVEDIFSSKDNDNITNCKKYECSECTCLYNTESACLMHKVDRNGKKCFNNLSRKHGKEYLENNSKTVGSKVADLKQKENRSNKIFKNNKIVVSSHEEAEAVLQKMYTRSGGEFKCTFCKAVKKHMSTLKYHMETHLDGLQYHCNKCDQISKSRISLYQHQRLKH